jgi:hypothetical protein
VSDSYRDHPALADGQSPQSGRRVDRVGHR